MKFLLLGLIVGISANPFFGNAVENPSIVIVGLNDKTVYSNDVQFEIQLTGSRSQDILGVYLLLDGESSRSIEDPPAPLVSPIVAKWDTTEASNGWHTLQAFASYPTGRNEDGGYEDYTGRVVRVKTFNPIVFGETLKTFGSANTGVPFAFPILATSSIATTQWKVTISTPSNQVLRVLTGATTNGAIETNWDGKDANGTDVRASVSWVDIEVETTPTNTESTAVGR
jgi:hypothetical protein